MSSSSFSASMSLASSSSATSPHSPPAAREPRHHQATSVTAGSSVVPPFSTAAAAQPWILRGALGGGQPPSLKPHGPFLQPPSLTAVGTKADQPIIIEEDEIQSLDEVIRQRECRPDPVYLIRLMESQEHVIYSSLDKP